MAKNMAVIENGVITNILWCDDGIAENETQKNIEDRLVEVGDTFENGKFFHNGVEVLTQQEILILENAEMREALMTLGVF